MAGLDLGTLASCHRQDLANEMHKSRISGSNHQPSINRFKRVRKARIGVRLLATINLLGARVREYQVLQKGS